MGQELLTVRELLNQLGVALVVSMHLRVDNQAALKQQLDGEKASSKVKHIDTRIIFVVHFTKTGVLKPDYCVIRQNAIFRVAITVPPHEELRRSDWLMPWL
jgi:hypothetical protein